MLKTIMTRAWEIYHETGCASRYEFALCLKMAWAENSKPRLDKLVTLQYGACKLTINTETGHITGDTYKAKTWIKDNFKTARWDSAARAWGATREDVANQLTQYAAYYSKFIVKVSAPEASSANQPMTFVKLVDGNDGFYALYRKADGTVCKRFAG